MFAPNRSIALSILLFALGTLGCGGTSLKQYEPTKDVAKKSIETALNTWKSGAPLATIDGKPAINVFDARWQAGNKLESFEILEEVAGTQHPQFKVRIKIAEEAEEVDEFLVVGIDPLLVFRDLDYQKTSGL